MISPSFDTQEQHVPFFCRWLGEYLYSDPRKENGTASTAIGIDIIGNDHFVTNTIVYSAKIGIFHQGDETFGETRLLKVCKLWVLLTSPLDCTRGTWRQEMVERE